VKRMKAGGSGRISQLSPMFLFPANHGLGDSYRALNRYSKSSLKILSTEPFG
jgi:hypothetical protein